MALENEERLRLATTPEGIAEAAARAAAKDAKDAKKNPVLPSSYITPALVQLMKEQ